MIMYYALIEPFGSKMCDMDSCKRYAKEAYIAYSKEYYRVWIYNRCSHHLRIESIDDAVVQVRFLLKILKKDFQKESESFLASMGHTRIHIDEVIRFVENMLI